MNEFKQRQLREAEKETARRAQGIIAVAFVLGTAITTVLILVLMYAYIMGQN